MFASGHVPVPAVDIPLALDRPPGVGACAPPRPSDMGMGMGMATGIAIVLGVAPWGVAQRVAPWGVE